METPHQDPPQQTDNEVDLMAVWFRRVVHSDTAAFEALFRAMRGGLVNYAAQITGDEASSSDIVQEAFLRFWQRREEHDPSGSVKALLFRTVRNLALNWVRDGKRRAKLLAEGYVSPHRPAPPPDLMLAGRELAGRLQEWMDELPERQREALTLSRFQGLSHEEVAAVMDVAPRTVNNHLVRALRTLKERLEAHREGSSVKGAG